MTARNTKLSKANKPRLPGKKAITKHPASNTHDLADIIKALEPEDGGRVVAWFHQFVDYRKKLPSRPKSGDASLTEAEEILSRVNIAQMLSAKDLPLALRLFDQALAANPPVESEVEGKRIYNATASMIYDLAPRDRLESMLVTQMTGVHNLAMEFLARSMTNEQPPEAVGANIERANKLLRTFTTQVEALNRHRGKGQQKMTVEHVHVHDGGQAIVGNVVQSKPSRGLPENGGGVGAYEAKTK